MTNVKDIIFAKQDVNLRISDQTDRFEFKATITEVDDKLFWIGLPRINGQVLMLQEKQKVKVSVSTRQAFYVAETVLEKIGSDSAKFYGLAIPQNFNWEKRNYLRVNYSTNVKFTSNDQSVQTTLVNFSAGGLMVFMVPKLAKMLQNGGDLYAGFRLDNVSFNIKVRFASLTSYDDIHYAGFEFLYLLPGVRKELETIANLYANKQK